MIIKDNREIYSDVVDDRQKLSTERALLHIVTTQYSVTRKQDINLPASASTMLRPAIRIAKPTEDDDN